MYRTIFICIVIVLPFSGVHAQDSAWIRIKPKYASVNGLHRLFFGDNYRFEWSENTRLPVIDVSAIDGGLRPIRLGGGHQTVSLRLMSGSGKEWVIRNIEKDASILLPAEIRNTFARDVIDDAMSAQHPFSPLVVAELAEAAGVPHASPVIGIIRSDTLLGEYNKLFAGRVCLVEEREPFGDSENSGKLFRDLDDDNDNTVDAAAFMKARLLDLLIADWDRHPDQWRWVDTRKGKSKKYIGIPRDRDQAFYVNEGLIPSLASRPWLVPILQGFDGKIRNVKYSLKEGSFLYSRPSLYLSLDEWLKITGEFMAKMSDSVLRSALRRLPSPAWEHRHEELFRKLRERRENLPAAIKEYYRFVYRYADIQLSNKHELVSITETPDGKVAVTARKIGKSGPADEIMNAVFSPGITKEIRVYSGKGNDSIMVNYHSPIKVRVIGQEGNKKLAVMNAGRKVNAYLKPGAGKLYGDLQRVNLRLSEDSLHTAYVPVNRYNVFKPVVGAGFNRDDGFLLALGFEYTRQGFRKTPYSSLNRLVANYSFATTAFRIRYLSEWMQVFGKNDLVVRAEIRAPQNTQNFFGKGNESVFIKTGDHITFYRSRFSTYTLETGIRWKNDKGMSVIIGPAFEGYSFDSLENKGRFLSNGSAVNSYDSGTLAKVKAHAGAFMRLEVNRRNSEIMPHSGYHLSVQFRAMGGLNRYSLNFAQIIPEFSVYAALNQRRTAVIANRTGGGLTIGKAAFYQSMFAGGHRNLLGYRQYRFAGDHSIYNNLEARIRIANFTGYIIPGEFGMTAFYDVGRVWVKDQTSDMWHQGVGGGFYFAPAKLAVLSVVAGYSKEGWYPYITLGFRY